MEYIVLFLIAIIIYQIAKAHYLSNKHHQEQQEHQKVVGLHQAKIDALEHEKSTLQSQIDKCFQEISALEKSLKESERKADFYKNIKSASGDLNVPSNPVNANNRRLDEEQSAVCNEIEHSNNNFFITGKAGTGKSFLLEAFKKTTQKKFIVLAPTGIAALNVGGTTLHSAFGYYNLVNLDVDDISDETILLKSEKKLALRHVSTIIIDEVSMVRADTFDKIDRILKSINKTVLPFGGKQILLFGDLFQLPPIAQPKEREYLFDRYGGLHFFFSNAYNQSNFRFRELTVNHRQKEDSEYFELLNRVRDGSVTPEDIKALNARIIQDYSVYDRFIMLLPTKAEVEKLNQNRIRQLDTREYAYSAKITNDKYPDKKHSLESLFPIASTLRLKKGALVMMVSNDPEHKWVNGKLGIVNELSSDSISVSIDRCIYDVHPVEFSEQEVTYENGKLVYENILTVSQYPIVPAYAITIHKSQGQTFRNIVCDIDRCFADGQAYVALSRCASLSGLHLTRKISQTSIQVNKSVLDFYMKNISPSADSIPV